jgi:hypothetical protein
MYAGRTRNGFTPPSREKLFKRFKRLEVGQCRFANLPELKAARWGVGLTSEKMKQCRWLKPVLVRGNGITCSRHETLPRLAHWLQVDCCWLPVPLEARTCSRQIASSQSGSNGFTTAVSAAAAIRSRTLNRLCHLVPIFILNTPPNDGLARRI